MAAALVAADPFSVNGVFQSFQLKPWKIVFANAELFRPASWLGSLKRAEAEGRKSES